MGNLGIPLVVQCHLIVSQLAHWRQIGRLQIRPTPRIWPKQRLLIGRELEMLASHWSRGPSESFQRGHPYDPEPAPIEHFWPQMTLGSSDCISIGSDWISISIGMDLNCYRIGSLMASDRIQICIILDHNWHLFWSQTFRLALNWLWFISNCFTRSLASIEASARGNHLEMKLYCATRL